jgi:hypothetical protein
MIFVSMREESDWGTMLSRDVIRLLIVRILELMLKTSCWSVRIYEVFWEIRVSCNVCDD